MDFKRLREQMVERQIVARGITDAGVIEAMRRVPRHLFVPKDMVGRAYEDCAVPIGVGQTISQPYMVALMTQYLQLNKGKCVLEVGTGCGYQAAVLAELSKEVYTIERIEELFLRAKQALHNLKYTNIKTFMGDGNLGVEDEGLLFDAIMVTAASKRPPDRLFAQLAANGRMAVPMGDRFSQSLMVFTKAADRIIEASVCSCTFVPLIGEYGWPLN